MILEVSWDILWTLSFGLSQFPGHGSWLVCDVALSLMLVAKALATPPPTSTNRWPQLAEQPCHLPHKRHFEGRRDDVLKNLGHRNYQEISTGNMWNLVVATPWPTETVVSRSLPPSLAQYPCFIVVNDEELPATRVVASRWHV